MKGLTMSDKHGWCGLVRPAPTKEQVMEAFYRAKDGRMRDSYANAEACDVMLKELEALFAPSPEAAPADKGESDYEYSNRRAASNDHEVDCLPESLAAALSDEEAAHMDTLRLWNAAKARITDLTAKLADLDNSLSDERNAHGRTLMLLDEGTAKLAEAERYREAWTHLRQWVAEKRDGEIYQGRAWIAFMEVLQRMDADAFVDSLIPPAPVEPKKFTVDLTNDADFETP